jgi:gamma-glutamylcyclotransferase (GGCT)/AIG2-like uncharacterized protein YtfP
MTKLFVYGTLKRSSIGKEVFGNIPESRRGAIFDYAVSRIKIGGRSYLAAEFSPGSRLNGLVLFIDGKQLARADKYEGKSYKRIRARLKGGGAVWIYAKRKRKGPRK